MGRRPKPPTLRAALAEEIPTERMEAIDREIDDFYRDALLGEHLVTEGLVTRHELQRALARQAVARGDHAGARRFLARDLADGHAALMDLVAAVTGGRR